VALSANIIKFSLMRSVPAERFWTVYETYRDASPRPSGTIFYGKRCRPDAAQARLAQDIPGINLIAIPTGRHNGPGFLKERGELAATLNNEIRSVLRRMGVPLSPAVAPKEEVVSVRAEPVAVVE